MSEELNHEQIDVKVNDNEIIKEEEKSENLGKVESQVKNKAEVTTANDDAVDSNPDQNEEDNNKKSQPVFITRKGKFYEHDDRLGEEEVGEGGNNGSGAIETVEKSKPVPTRNRNHGPDSDRWKHDRFNPDEQNPKSTRDILRIYGYDIRKEGVVDAQNDQKEEKKQITPKSNPKLNDNNTNTKKSSIKNKQNRYNSNNYYDEYYIKDQNQRPNSTRDSNNSKSNQQKIFTNNHQQQQQSNNNDKQQQQYKSHNEIKPQQHQQIIQNNQQEQPKRYSSMRNQRNNNYNNNNEINTKPTIQSTDNQQKQNKDLNNKTNNNTNSQISYSSPSSSSNQNNTNYHPTSNIKQQINNKNIQIHQQQQPQYINQPYYETTANSWQITPQSGRPIVGGTQVQIHTHPHQIAFNQALQHQMQHQIIAPTTAAPTGLSSPQLVQPQYYYLPADYSNHQYAPQAQQTASQIFYAPPQPQQPPQHHNNPQTIIPPTQHRPSKAIPIVKPESVQVFEKKN